MRKPITEKEKELAHRVVEYVKRKDLENEDAIAICLLCRGDENAQTMIEYLNENPDIEFTPLLEKATEMYLSKK